MKAAILLFLAFGVLQSSSALQCYTCINIADCAKKTLEVEMCGEKTTSPDSTVTAPTTTTTESISPDPATNSTGSSPTTTTISTTNSTPPVSTTENITVTTLLPTTTTDTPASTTLNTTDTPTPTTLNTTDIPGPTTLNTTDITVPTTLNSNTTDSTPEPTTPNTNTSTIETTTPPTNQPPPPEDPQISIARRRRSVLESRAEESEWRCFTKTEKGKVVGKGCQKKSEPCSGDSCKSCDKDKCNGSRGLQFSIFTLGLVLIISKCF